MKVGVYIDGLGQSVAQESVLKYGERLTNEFRYHNTGIKYYQKIEKVKYAGGRTGNVVNIMEKKGDTERAVYKIYEFKYADILTSDFKRKNIFFKGLVLFGLAFRKIPLLIKRIFVSNGYYRPFHTFYIFFIFFVISLAILFALPSVITIFINFIKTESESQILSEDTLYKLDEFSKMFVAILAGVLLIIPRADFLVSSLAGEFVCTHLYLEYGKQKQDVLGYLDQLVEHIVENEKEAEIHFHAYSFGSVIAIDYLFPFGKTPSGNLVERARALIVIGTPFEIIKSYYPNYYLNRSLTLQDKIYWMNVYSISDALSSNFRFDNKVGESQYGITKEGTKPFNLNYEVIYLNEYNFFNFLSLMSIKAHAMFWSEDPSGQSCLSNIYVEMKKREMFNSST